MTAVSEERLLERLGEGRLVESADQMSSVYFEGMKRILTVSADTELISAPAYYRAAQDAPSTNAYISAMSIIQDELGHAHIAYRMLEDMGVNKEQLVYERKPEEFKYPYAFDVPLETWTELAVANALYDRAGFVLLGDVFKHGSYGPWKRALAKVDKEENFHLRHGETWMRKINEQPGGHEALQEAVDWMFPLTVEWFGLPDDLKRHTEQIEYGFKGSTNDELRQIWMSTAVPFLTSLDLDVPAHYDEAQDKYVLDFPFPSRFIAEEKRWLFEEGQITWDQVIERWKARGPMNAEYVHDIQRGYDELYGNGADKRTWQEIVQ
ncbi:MAG: Phenylacetic acid catabolic protein [Candidatus Promineifilaceae bacterium]|nr:Phenylacetic acid catabolic protein [Candidatus Promineifilaceae bacterium]